MMRRLCKKVAGRLAPGYLNPGDLEARAKVGQLEGWLSILLNTLMAAAKGGLGLSTGSLALLSDAVHTLADSASSVVVVLGFRAARRPPDEEHPFGHGRVESVAGLVIGVLLAVTAVELGVAAAERILDPRPVDAPGWVVAVVMGMALVKELMARFSLELGRLIDSPALEADGWHHRSDVLATGLVGLSFVGAWLGLGWLDGAAGVGVAVFIGWAAAEILRGAVGPLIGQRAPDELVEWVRRTAAAVDGVAGVHAVAAHSYGTRAAVTLHVELASEMSARDAHNLGVNVERLLVTRPGTEATVHVDLPRMA